VFSESLGRVSAVWVVGFHVLPASGVLFNVASALSIGLDVEGESGEQGRRVRGERFEQLMLCFDLFVVSS
jgi:hypothetical protein